MELFKNLQNGETKTQNIIFGILFSTSIITVMVLIHFGIVSTQYFVK